MPTANTMLTGVLAEHVRAVNAFDTDAVVATFAEDAFINEKDPEPPRKAPNLSPEPRPNASPCSLTTRPRVLRLGAASGSWRQQRPKLQHPAFGTFPLDAVRCSTV
jgi:hypothetical protein